MLKFLFLPPLILLLSSCAPTGSPLAPLTNFIGGGFGGTSVRSSPLIANVSGWDPKEVQRQGDRYSQNDVSALRKNGAQALIARSAKGPLLDDKFGDFLKAADRQGMLLGAYHYVTMDQRPSAQAESFVRRVRSIARQKGISQRQILLVGDFDTRSTPDRLVEFIVRVEQLTGVTPVVYLENSDALRARLNNASASQKRTIRRAPYWLALYSQKGTERTMSRFPTLTPDNLMELYGIWDRWAMWQYGGVIWQNGRSSSKHYNSSSWSSPPYFGSLAMPMERSVFNGSQAELRNFWRRHSLTL